MNIGSTWHSKPECCISIGSRGTAPPNRFESKKRKKNFGPKSENFLIKSIKKLPFFDRFWLFQAFAKTVTVDKPMVPESCALQGG